MQFFVHYFLHLGFPFLIAWFVFPTRWKTVYLLLLATMLIDLDHLLAQPIFDASRCSIGFHPLHSLYIIPIYIGFIFFKKTRIVGIGILLHLVTDTIDCFWMFEKCGSCFQHSIFHAM
ncbi:MAG: hypothetical protein E6Q37_08165 [Crocinitomicaceae bacterium]|nr:MAG: hypothetical protein E6Q37_08165 [Crocinitomicaceae bacterium]